MIVDRGEQERGLHPAGRRSRAAAGNELPRVANPGRVDDERRGRHREPFRQGSAGLAARVLPP